MILSRCTCRLAIFLEPISMKCNGLGAITYTSQLSKGGVGNSFLQVQQQQHSPGVRCIRSPVATDVVFHSPLEEVSGATAATKSDFGEVGCIYCNVITLTIFCYFQTILTLHWDVIKGASLSSVKHGAVPQRGRMPATNTKLAYAVCMPRHGDYDSVALQHLLGTAPRSFGNTYITLIEV